MTPLLALTCNKSVPCCVRNLRCLHSPEREKVALWARRTGFFSFLKSLRLPSSPNTLADMQHLTSRPLRFLAVTANGSVPS